MIAAGLLLAPAPAVEASGFPGAPPEEDTVDITELGAAGRAPLSVAVCSRNACTIRREGPKE